MIYCPKCGVESPPNAKYCGDCGSEIEPTKGTCPKCGSETDPQKKFCVFCGVPLGAGETPPPSAIDEDSLAEKVMKKIKEDERKEEPRVVERHYTPTPAYQPPRVDVRTKSGGGGGWIVAIIVIIILAVVAFLVLQSGAFGGAVVCGSSEGIILIGALAVILRIKRGKAETR